MPRATTLSLRPSMRIGPVWSDPSASTHVGVSGPTEGQVRGPHWRRTSRGLYVPATVDHTNVEQRIVEAAAVLPSVGGVTGWASLKWAGGDWFDGLDLGGRSELPVDLATCYQDIRNQNGFVVHQERLGPAS